MTNFNVFTSLCSTCYGGLVCTLRGLGFRFHLFAQSTVHPVLVISVSVSGEGYGCMYVPSVRNCSEVCCRNKRTICSGSWTSPRIRFQPFPVFQHDGFADVKHQKRSTLTDDVRGWCGAVHKGDRRAGVGTGAVQGSLGEVRNESVKSKNRVKVPAWNAIIGSIKKQSAQHPAERWTHECRSEQEDLVWVEQLGAGRCQRSYATSG